MCSLSLSRYTTRQSLYLHQRQKPPIPSNPLSENQAEAMLTLCTQHLLPTVGGEEITRLCRSLKLSRLGIGRFNTDTMAFCHQHDLLH